MFAWMFATGQYSPAQAAQRTLDEGYKCASLELDDYDNMRFWGDFHDECDQRGLRVGAWFTDGHNIKQAPLDAHFVVSELESEDDYQGILSNPTPSVPHAVLTNFTPLTDGNGVPQPQKAKPLIDAGWRCLTEAYVGDNPNATPDRLYFTARQCGWSLSQPVFGVYNKPLVEYSQWMQGGWGVYLGEYVL